MGSSSDASPPPSAEFIEAFRALAGGEGTLNFARFMALALYHPEIGYYRRNRKRVGYGAATDFFTSSTSGPVFGHLVAASCREILVAAGRDPRQHTFVEIGAEPGHSVLANIPHPFRAAETLRLGEPLRIEGDCVVFSNELFDAQPFNRTVFAGGKWHEIGVALSEGRLMETLLPCHRDRPGVEGYHFDEPVAAAELAATIADQPWQGLFVALDYGKTLNELLSATPAGTARAYHRHAQSNNLLSLPGEQDLTCHICWDWLCDSLTERRFRSPTLESQEAFFIRHAGDYIAPASREDARVLSSRKLALMQLLHPSHLGQKFQALFAIR
jgi:SAM-dependent MidA family methyltransferase